MNFLWKFLFITTVLPVIFEGVQCKINHKMDKYSGYNSNQDLKQNKETQASGGFGLSAWGIIFLTVSLILMGVVAYYVAIFYPLLCKKERKYDRIELATV